MEIKYLGHSSFCIKGKSATVVTDPFSQEATGLKFPKHIEANLVTVSHHHADHNATDEVDGSPFVIDGPGEYDVKGVSVIGFPSFHDAQKGLERGLNTMYRIEMDGLSMVHLGDLGHMLSTEEVELLDGVDILFVPVGGIYTIDAAIAKAITTEIEPKIVIPMHYMREGLDTRAFAGLSPVSNFLKELGKEEVPAVAKLSITREKLPELMQVVIFE
jgi:L-ascorbate metabolism protein UlaG (beta-lactamase superfamily)